MSANRYLRWEPRPGRGVRGPRRSMLWPVHVWTVIAPDMASRRINVFQEAILGLLRSGLRDLDKMALCLDLAPELVAFIINTQLQPNQWIDDQWMVTLLGEQVLDGDRVEQVTSSVHYAFQDAITGRWLPRLAQSLPEVQPMRTDSRVPEFVLDLDTGRRERPFILPALLTPGTIDDKSGAKQALVQFLRDVRRQHLQEDDFVDEAIGEDFDFLEEAPSLAYVWCEIFVSEGDLLPWLVNDPWGITPAAAWLREPLMGSLSRFPGLGKRIADLLNAPSDNAISFEEWLLQLDMQVELQLADLPHLHAHPLLCEHVARLLRQLRRIEGQNRSQQEELSGLAQESMSLLEAVLKWILKTWPPNTSQWPRLDRVGSKCLCELPLVDPLSDNTARLLGGQEARQVELAARYHDRALKALLTAALLTTYQHEDHPFCHLTGATLRFDILMEFVELRNKGSHASGERLERDSVLAMAKFALDWHEQFTPYY